MQNAKNSIPRNSMPRNSNVSWNSKKEVNLSLLCYV